MGTAHRTLGPYNRAALAEANRKQERAALQTLLLADRPALLYGQLALVTVFWGFNSIAAKVLTNHLPPYTVTFLRSGIAAALLIALARATGGWSSPRGARDVLMCLLLGALGIVGSSGLWFAGIRLTTASEAALLSATGPVITAVLAALFLGDPLTRGRMLGVVLSVLGAGLIAGVEVRGGGVGERAVGYALLLGGALAWALFLILGRWSMARFTPLTSTALASAAGALLMLPLVVAEGPLPAIMAAPWIVWPMMAYAAVFGVVISWVWWYAAIERIGATRVAVFGNMVPLSTVALAAVLLHERLTPTQIAGGLLVVSSVWLINRPRPAPAARQRRSVPRLRVAR